MQPNLPQPAAPRRRLQFAGPREYDPAIAREQEQADRVQREDERAGPPRRSVDCRWVSKWAENVVYYLLRYPPEDLIRALIWAHIIRALV